PPHDVRAARAHQPAGRRRVGVVGALVAEMPAMELAPTLAEWILAALIGPSDETVERYRHVARRVRHRRPLGSWFCGLHWRHHPNTGFVQRDSERDPRWRLFAAVNSL